MTIGSRLFPLVLLGAGLGAGLGACAEVETAASDAGVATGSDAGRVDGDAGTTGDPNILVGSFRIKLTAPNGATPGFTSVFGKVYDGPTPAQLVWEETAAAGDCKLLEPRVPFCAVPCAGGSVCIEDDRCAAYPSAKSAGTLTVRGLRPVDPLAINPIANNYQSTAALPYPAFDEGAAITAEASGDAVEAFVLEARGIAPFVFTSTAPALVREEPFELSWVAAGVAEVSSIHVKIDLSHHGGTKGMIECDTADTGALSIPASLTTALLDLGVAGFPSVIVTRTAQGSAVIAEGRINLIISSDIEAAIEIPGLMSCLSDEECTNGQACQADLTCG